jgi:fatty-acyl-CoA synthase
VNEQIGFAPTTTTMILRALSRFPGREAFVWDGGKLTYSAVRDLISGLQSGMVEGGLRKGDVVALLASNSAEAWCAGIAAQALGLLITWLHPLGSLTDHLAVIEDIEATVLVVDPKTHGQRGGELASRAAGQLKVTFTMGRAEFGRDLLAAARSAGSVPVLDLTNINERAIVNYTGGTTGRSKGAIRRHRALMASTLTVAAEFGLPNTPRYLAAAPITHVSGSFVLPSLSRGGTVHLLKGFDPEEFLATIARSKINVTMMVPTMIYVMLDDPKLETTDLSSLELLLYGASPMSPTRLVEGLERIGPIFGQLYGQTECYPISLLGRADHDARRPELFASCGFPLASCTVSLLDENNQPVAKGEAGEICVRATQAMEGYWKRPEQTAETFRRRLAAHRRHRAGRRARLSLHRRSQEGHDRLGRLQYLSARGRGRAVVASRCSDGLCHRHPPSQMGRGRHGSGGRQAR